MRSISCNEIMTYQDKIYLVYRKVKQRRIKEGRVNDLKMTWFCDLVVKDKNLEDSVLMFLREVSDAEIIEDQP